ncbi:MAG: HD domain-containing protein [Anaerolineales bacterium]
MTLIQQARTWYPSDDIHGWGHISRVYYLAEKLAQTEGADLEIVRAAALLHDAADADPSHKTARASHQHASAAFARRILSEAGWPEARIRAVEHCIRAHRYRERSEEPQTLEAKILFDADKLDAIGAIGVARAVAHAAMSGQPLYAPPSETFLQTGKTEDGEPHSAYHEYAFKLRHIQTRLYTPAAREMASARHRLMTQYFEELAHEMNIPA